MQNVDVVVVGGGFAGAAAAIGLADGRRHILVLEAGHGTLPRFAGEFIQPAGVAVLGQLGVMPALREQGALSGNGFSVWPSVEGPAALLPYLEVPGLQDPGLYLEHGRMVEALRKRAAAMAGVTLQFDSPVASLLRDPGGAVTGLRLEDGQEVRARLTILADGRFSRMRNALGIPFEARLLSRTAAILVPEAEVPADGFGHVFLGAFGPILAYPLSGRRVRFCFDLPPEGAGDPEALRGQIREDYAPHVPEPLRSALLRTLDRGEPFPVAPTHSVRTARCAGPGFVLIGDTAGCSHPLTAAGLTMALHDVAVLREELASLDVSLPPRAWDGALGRYQRRRYRFSDAREGLTSALYDVFRGTTEAHRLLRTAIFRYWTSDPRNRSASLALLSGHDSRVSTFLREFMRVAALAVRDTLPTLRSRPSPASDLRALPDLVRVTASQVAHNGLPLVMPRDWW